MDDLPALELVKVNSIPTSEIVSLLSESLSTVGASKKTNDFWAWKHQKNVFGETSGYAAKNNGKLIAVRPFLKWHLRASDVDYIETSRPVDTATAKEAQGKGVFTRLTNEYLNNDTSDIRFIFNTPNSNSLPGNLKLGWIVRDELTLFLKITKSLSFAKQLFIKQPISASCLDSDHCPNVFLIKKLSSQQVLIFFSRAETFESNRPFQGFRTSKSFDFFEWRYLKQPNVDYAVYVKKDNEEIIGLIFFRIEVRYGILGCVICDLLVRDYNEKAIKSLIADFHKENPLSFCIAHFSRQSIESAVLRKSLYVPIKKVKLAVNFLENKDSKFIETPWDLTFGDLEVF